GPGKPGADDNGSGTSAVLEISRLLSRYKFYRTIKFIAFGGEELGLLGSRDYALKHKNDGIHAVINLDMIMWDDDADQIVQVHQQPNSGNQYSADLGQFILEVNNTYSLPTVVMIIPNGTTRSDHASFWAHDKSAVLLIEEFTSPADFNPYYHSVLDTWQKASASKHQQFFKSVTKLAAASIAELAGVLGPLPVELTAFDAVLQGGRVILRWSTATETNNAGFVIERLSDNRPAVIGFVPGAGTTSEPRSYRFIDNKPVSGTSLYRLRQTDTDGTVSFSRWVMVSSSSSSTPVFAAYPNPARRDEPLTIDIAAGSTENLPVRVTLHDVLGRTITVVYEGMTTAGLRQIQANLSSLSPGMYFLRAVFPDRVMTRKIRVSR
ncbi:MAG: M28 family peptidase, partial [Chlorobi bacterium]|nr:M28 family peptidase [Chlorobiota bacterium]